MSDWGDAGAALGSIFGGSEDAYQAGRLRTAQTESALANARKTQLEATAEAQKAAARDHSEEALIATGRYTPAEAHALALMMEGGTGSDFKAGMEGFGTQQEMGYRDTVADPNTPNNVRQANLAAISGKPFSPLESVGPGGYTDITAANPTLMTTPVGESTIRENNAQAANANASAAKTRDEMLHPERYRSGSAGPGGINVPYGYMLNPDFNPALPQSETNLPVVPIMGGPADPNVGPPMGQRERSMLSGMLHAGLEASQRLETISLMPVGADQGLWTQHPGTSVMDAAGRSLLWAVSPQDTQLYNVAMSGVARNLAILENYGRGAPTTGQIAAIADQLSLRPGDTVATMMLKMADYRNTVENAAETFLAMNKNRPDDATKTAEKMLATARRAVPFTMNDVIAYQAASKKNPGLTIGEFTRQRMLTQRPGPAPAPAAAPGAAPAAAGTPTFATEAEAAAAAASGKIQHGTRIIVGGVSGTWQ